MIILRITSGLGNQMFQYAFYTLLKEKYKDTTVLCDTYWFNNNHEHRSYELEKIFDGVEGSLFEIKKAPLLKVISLSGKVPNLFSGMFGPVFDKIRRYINRLLKNNLLKKRMPYIIDELEGDISTEDVTTKDGTINNPFFDLLMNLDTSKDYYIMGYFISEKYFSQCYELVKKKLVFPKITETYNIAYAKEMQECDSVSIHVRRGDYLSDLYKDTFMTLGKEYYENAVSYIEGAINSIAKKEERKADIRYFVFSDDIEFVNNEFSWLENKVIVAKNAGEKSFRDMQLMSLCKHNIIANSTFSQWGALLNSNDDHITIYPKVYMKDHDNELKTLHGWVRL